MGVQEMLDLSRIYMCFAGLRETKREVFQRRRSRYYDRSLKALINAKRSLLRTRPGNLDFHFISCMNNWFILMYITC